MHVASKSNIINRKNIHLHSLQKYGVDNAEIFPDILDKFLVWSYDGIINKQDVLFCSWGFYDKYQLEKDCLRYNINSRFIKNHISLKHQFPIIEKAHKLPLKGIGMSKALNLLNIPLEGRHHRGIDDAVNIAKIFMKFYDEWQY